MNAFIPQVEDGEAAQGDQNQARGAQPDAYLRWTRERTLPAVVFRLGVDFGTCHTAA